MFVTWQWSVHTKECSALRNGDAASMTSTQHRQRMAPVQVG
jgi:hypothetical protein